MGKYLQLHMIKVNDYIEKTHYYILQCHLRWTSRLTGAVCAVCMGAQRCHKEPDCIPLVSLDITKKNLW